MLFSFENSRLCEYIWNEKCSSNDDKVRAILNGIKEHHSFSDEHYKLIESKIRNNFLPQYNKKWQSVSRKREGFLKSHKSFYENNVTVDLPADYLQNNVSISKENEFVQRDRGRPRVSYEQGSQSTRRRREEDIASKYSTEELERALAIRKRRSDIEKPNETIHEDEHEHVDFSKTLAMYMDLEFSKRKYEKLRVHNENIINSRLYPPYIHVKEAKIQCYPEHILPSKYGANVHLISLLEHTTKRILCLVDKHTLATISGQKLTLVGKWGMDGAANQQTTRQSWKSDDDSYNNADKQLVDDQSTDEFSEYDGITDDSGPENCQHTESSNYDRKRYIRDSSVFITSFVPLQLKAGCQVLWTNNAPSSVHYCRPIRFRFVKETSTLVNNDYRYYVNLIDKVKTYTFQMDEMSYDVSFQLHCTMIDGKVCNFLTGQRASQCCNICRVGPKKINDLAHIKSLTWSTEFYRFGLSTLHCWVRFMEYILHVSYNMDIAKGSARSEQDKASKEKRKENVQESLRKLSIVVDVVKQGFGTSNTGNVARAFFAQADAVSGATGLNANLIIRLHTILQCLTCGKLIDTTKFHDYCEQTMLLCTKLYSWYKIPPSVHKVLCHGSDIILYFQQHFNIPIGWLSEEAQEANNKIFRKARGFHSRMADRTKTNEDTMHHMLISSDPLISSMRIKEVHEPMELSKDAQQMLL